MITLFSSLQPRPARKICDTSLSIKVDDEIIAIPHSIDASHEHEEEFRPQISGVVNVVTTQERALSYLTVELVEKQDLPARSGYPAERARLQRAALGIDLSTLPSGSHTVTFTLAVPESVQAHQHSYYGSISHAVHATVYTSSSGIVTSEAPVFLVAVPYDSMFAAPRPEIVTFRTEHAVLGPIHMDVLSSKISAGSLAQVTLSFPNPVDACDVVSVELFVVQKFEIARGGTSWQSAPVEHLRTTIVALGDDDPLPYHLSEREPRSFRRIVRIPGDDRLRPSTFPNAEKIRVSHRLKAEITYYRRQTTITSQTLIMTKNIVVASCGLAKAEESLPSYSTQACPVDVKTVHCSVDCACCMTVDDLWECDKDLFARSGPATPNVDAPSQTSSDGKWTFVAR